jgi:NhaA family Na+:H+ antiporter
MSLFIGALAFPAPPAQDLAKVGILVGSLVSGAVGLAALRGATGLPRALPPAGGAGPSLRGA